MSAGSGCFEPFFCFGFIAPLIIAAMSTLAFDSTPPVASILPSLVNAIDVIDWPGVPAAIAPITLVIIAAMSAMLGMVGIWPGLICVGGLKLAIGDALRSRSLLPDCTSQSESWPMPPMTAIDFPSALNSACIGISPGVIERKI